MEEDDSDDFYDLKKGRVGHGIRSISSSMSSKKQTSFNFKSKSKSSKKRQRSAEPLPEIFYERFDIRISPNEIALHLSCKQCSFRYTTNHSKQKTMLPESRNFALNHECRSERWKGWR